MPDTNLVTLNEINNQPEVKQDLNYFRNPDNRPKHLQLDVADISRRFSVSGETLQTWANRPEDSWFKRQYKGLGAGIVRTGQQISDLPQLFKNLGYRYNFPNANEETASKLMEMGLRRQMAIGESRAYHEKYEGTDDSIAANISGALGSALTYGAVALGAGAIAGPGASVATVGVLAGAQATAETAESYAEEYARRTGDYKLKDYDKSADAIAFGYGALSGFIESALGIEGVVGSLFGKTTRRTLVRTATGFAGEATEEAIQEFTGGIAGKIAGYEDRNWQQITMDSLVAAVYGGIVGGAMGGSLYYVHRNRLARQFEKLGFAKDESRQLADAAVDGTMNQATKEAFTFDSLQSKLGQPFNDLVGKIETTLNSAGWKDKITDPDTGMARDVHEYARIVASDIAAQTIRQASILNVPVNEVLDLNEIQVDENRIFLKPQEFGTAKQIKAKIDEKKAQIKELTAGAKVMQGDPARKKELQMQVAILDKWLKRKERQEKADTENRQQALKDMGLEFATKDADSDIKYLNKRKTVVTPNQLAKKYDITVEQAQRRLELARLRDIVGTNKTFEKLLINPENAKIVSVLQGKNNLIRNNPELLSDVRNAIDRLIDLGNRNFASTILNPTKTVGNVFGQNAVMYVLKFGEINQINQFFDIYQAKSESNVNGDTFNPGTFNANDLYAQSLVNTFPESFDENGKAITRDMSAVFLSQNNQQVQGNQLFQKQLDLAAENARLDDIYPAYTGDTINIDGVERTVYNSNGERIAKSEPALRNFYKWFGDSKVVDSQGRPLVVYHGARTETQFNTFRQGVAFFTNNRDVAQVFSDEYAYNLVVDGKKIPLDYDTAQHLALWLSGYDYDINDVIEWNNFADLIQERGQESYEDERDSGEFQSGNLDMVDLFNANDVHFEIGSQPMAMYLKIENPKIVDAKGQEWLAGKFDDSDMIDLSGKYDGSIIKNIKEGGPTATMRDLSDVPVADDYIVYSNTQIKSVNNRGTFSEDTGNIYFQTAYAGSRVDYDRPSLEAIGSGEGNQAHGWGLYYALNPEIADRYRKSFLTGDSLYESYSYNGGDLSYIEDTVIADIAEKVINTKKTKQEIIKDKIAENEKDIQINKKGLETAESEDDKSFRREQIEDSEEALQFLKKLNPDDIVIKSGQVHEVDIPEMDLLLDEQKTFDEQSEFVKSALDSIDIKNYPNFANAILNGKTGKNIYNSLIIDIDAINEKNDVANAEPDKQASQLLEQYGIKGITYDGREDGRCFVIFNSDDVKVLRKKFDELGNVLFQNNSTNTTGNGKDKRDAYYQEMGGLYDPELNVIVLGRDFNTGTLPHEMAHFWLQDIFNRSKADENWTPEFKNQVKTLFDILGVKDGQTNLTTAQHEKFARMTEAVVFGLATAPEGTVLPQLAYLNWIPPKYKSLQAIRYRDENGRLRYPVLDKAAMDFFNAWYANPFMPVLGVDSPEQSENVNPDNQPALPEIVAERREKSDIDVSEQQKADAELDKAAQESTPTNTRAVMASYELENSRKVNELNAKREKEFNPEQKSPLSFLKYGRGTNTQGNIRTVATDYVKKNKKHAEEIAFGNPDQSAVDFVQNDSGIDRISLIREVMKNYKKGTREYADLYRNQAIEATLAGKTTGLNNDISFQYYLDGYKKLYAALELRAAKAYAGNKKNAVEVFNRDIDSFIRERVDSILKLPANSKERNNAIDAMMLEAEMQFGGGASDSRLLFQTNTLGQSATGKQREAFIAWANKYIKDHITDVENKLNESELITLSDKAQVAEPDLNSPDAKKAIAAAKVIAEWQRFVNAQNPSPSFVAKTISQWSPMAMLLNLNTHAINIISTGINRGLIKTAMKASFKYGKQVDTSVLNAELQRITKIFNATMLDYAQMVNPLSPALLHGEKITIGREDIDIQKGDKLRTKVFKGVQKATYYTFGKEDFFYRSRAYIEALNYIATRDAKGDANIANQLFKEYARFDNTKNSTAYKARVEAINIANMTTFVQNGKLAQVATKIRRTLNSLTGNPDAGIGTILAPFAKVPSNVVEQGIKSFKTVYRAPTELYHKAMGKTVNWGLEDNINAINFGFAMLVGIIAGALGDYEPPYDPSEKKKYDPKKPYDSITFGKGVWFKLDTFGALEVPIRIAALWSSGKGAGFKETLGAVPLAGEFAGTWQQAMDASSSSEKALRFGLNFSYNLVDRTVPAIAKQIMSAANLGDAELENIDIGVKTGIGRKIGRRYGLDGDDRQTIDYINDILALGLNRVKITEQKQ